MSNLTMPETSGDVQEGLQKEAKTVGAPEEKEETIGMQNESGKVTLSHQADTYPMRRTNIPFLGRDLSFNAFTSLFGCAFLWGLSIWCMADPTNSNDKLLEWKADVTQKFTWIYIISNPSFFFFILWLSIRYGAIKLGKKEEKPEFSDLAYFTMIFSVGVSIGLLFYGVSEPLWHRSSNWYAEAGYHSQDEIDQFAMMLTVYHWGCAAWSPYIVVAMAAGVAAYRFDLPMTVRSTLYPMLGPFTWGWIGDVVDGFSIVTTVAGACTGLGLGAMQIATGAVRLGWIDTLEESGLTKEEYEDDMTDKQCAIIWVITAITAASVVSGLGRGIKFLSQIGFALGMILLFLCLVMEKTNYILNLTVQTMGYYFQKCLFQIHFWTDAFGQLEDGEGRATDGNSAASQWMNRWTVFYMAWRTACGAFVGLFLARISRGRTIREVAVYSFIAPLMHSFLWFCTFGGIGLRQARQADELEHIGEEYFGSGTHFRQGGSDFCYEVPQEDVLVNGTVVFSNSLLGITPVCQFDSNDATQAWFNVMYSFSYPETSGDFEGYGGFMAGLSLVALTVYFVTMSDSGSLIVVHLASNGQEEHHWLQRVFWAFTEGAVAAGLLKAGGKDALDAFQAASIIIGLLFTFVIFCMMHSMMKMCRVAEEQDRNGASDGKLPDPEKNSFKMHICGGIANIFEYIASLGQVHQERVSKGMDLPSVFEVQEFLLGLLLPFCSLYRILVKMKYNFLAQCCLTLAYFLLHALSIVFFSLSEKNFGYVAFGFSCFFMNACILTAIRVGVRDRQSLDGNVIADFAASSFFYPQALSQMRFELSEVSEEVVQV